MDTIYGTPINLCLIVLGSLEEIQVFCPMRASGPLHCKRARKVTHTVHRGNASKSCAFINVLAAAFDLH